MGINYKYIESEPGVFTVGYLGIDMEWIAVSDHPDKETAAEKALAMDCSENKNFNLVHFLEGQINFSLETFGPGGRHSGLIDHIKKELEEIEAAPNDLEEWIDVVILAFDGAWRAGYKPTEIAIKMHEKLNTNKERSWPDWRITEEGKAIEHIKAKLK